MKKNAAIIIFIIFIGLAALYFYDRSMNPVVLTDSKMVFMGNNIPGYQGTSCYIQETYYNPRKDFVVGVLYAKYKKNIYTTDQKEEIQEQKPIISDEKSANNMAESLGMQKMFKIRPKIKPSANNIKLTIKVDCSNYSSCLSDADWYYNGYIVSKGGINGCENYKPNTLTGDAALYLCKNPRK